MSKWRYNLAFYCLMGSLILSLHTAAILKKDDPVARTQADPILFSEKMEQEKDGKKEAPMPSFKLYGEKGQLHQSPVGAIPKDEPEEFYIKPKKAFQDQGAVSEVSDKTEPYLEEPPESAEIGIPEAEAPGAVEEESYDSEDWWAEEGGNDAVDATDNTVKETSNYDENGW